MPVADCGAFEVSERSEVGVLESYLSLGSLLGLRRNNRSRQRRDKKSPLSPLKEAIPKVYQGYTNGR